MKEFIQIGRNISLVSQLGVSISAPIILSVWAAGWITNKFELGNWVMLVGIVLGLGGSIASAVKFYRYAVKRKGGNQK
ncbi:AtpZ/AtpI family protein [Lachnospiraceae bacterium 54-53]